MGDDNLVPPPLLRGQWRRVRNPCGCILMMIWWSRFRRGRLLRRQLTYCSIGGEGSLRRMWRGIVRWCDVRSFWCFWACGVLFALNVLLRTRLMLLGHA